MGVVCLAQALLHAPVLRSFYLGGGHLREACRWSSPAEPCLSCELVRPGRASRQRDTEDNASDPPALCLPGPLPEVVWVRVTAVASPATRSVRQTPCPEHATDVIFNRQA